MKKLNGEFLNKKPFSHVCRNGIKFQAERCDFKGGVKVIIPSMYEGGPKDNILVIATAEMIGFHAANIWGYLNGFQGYDCIDFVFVQEVFS